jgi:hypothetical protein
MMSQSQQQQVLFAGHGHIIMKRLLNYETLHYLNIGCFRKTKTASVMKQEGH